MYTDVSEQKGVMALAHDIKKVHEHSPPSPPPLTTLSLSWTQSFPSYFLSNRLVTKMERDVRRGEIALLR